MKERRHDDSTHRSRRADAGIDGSSLPPSARRDYKTPVLMLTPGRVEDRVAGLDAGADDYVT